jgi:pimeloyl-ACP methyl ester carboxylesterase
VNAAQSGLPEPLLLLPGLLCDETIWDKQIREFSGHLDVRVACYGDADSIEEMARRAVVGLQGRFAVAGHSMGGRVAMEIVRTAPERVSRLALLDTGIHPAIPSEREKRLAFVDIAYAKGMSALCDAWLPPMVHPMRRKDAALMRPLEEMVNRSTPALFEAQIRALLNRPDAAPALASAPARLKETLLVGVGRQDSWSPAAQHEEIIRVAGGGKLVLIEDAGHMAPLEAPRSVNAALKEWLAGGKADQISTDAMMRKRKPGSEGQ